MASMSPYGRVTLVSGPESLLAERAVRDLVARARTEAPGTEVTEIDAGRVDAPRLAEMVSASLFSTARVAVLTELADLDPGLHTDLLQHAKAQQPDLALILVHGGGPKGKGLLDKLKALKVDVVEAAGIKQWELPQFVSAEIKLAGGSAGAGAPQSLVDALGHDLRTLAGAVAQLVADSEDGVVSSAQVRRYFGGRAEVTSFAVADAALAGRTGVAMEQLRWALSTGVAPVLVSSAMASGLRGLGRLITAGTGLREADLARTVGVPPWKLKSMRQQARGWDETGVATALRAVAVADAAVKGAADDASFALEQMVLTVSRSRRG